MRCTGHRRHKLYLHSEPQFAHIRYQQKQQQQQQQFIKNRNQTERSHNWAPLSGLTHSETASQAQRARCRGDGLKVTTPCAHCTTTAPELQMCLRGDTVDFSLDGCYSGCLQLLPAWLLIIPECFLLIPFVGASVWVQLACMVPRRTQNQHRASTVLRAPPIPPINLSQSARPVAGRAGGTCKSC